MTSHVLLGPVFAGETLQSNCVLGMASYDGSRGYPLVMCMLPGPRQGGKVLRARAAQWANSLLILSW